MLINFCFGKFLHYPYVLFLGEDIPNFSGNHACMHACMCVCVCECMMVCGSKILSFYSIPRRQPWSDT
jgi:hypothetical protein